jgi:hypothetical protein
MQWDAIGAVGEIVGALAVVATLFYLARQIRYNSKVSKADMSKDLFLATRSATLDLARDPDLARLNADIRGIGDVQLLKRVSFYQSFFRLYELVYTLHRQDLVDEGIFESYLRMIRVFIETEYFDEFWEFAEPTFQADFYQFVSEERAALRGKNAVGKS